LRLRYAKYEFDVRDSASQLIFRYPTLSGSPDFPATQQASAF
jgi:hypothetical protein